MWIYDHNWNIDICPPITTASDFKLVHGLAPEEVMTLAQEGSIVPIPDIDEDRGMEFMRRFFADLERKAIPFIPKHYAYMLANDFQIENKILLPTSTDPSYGYVQHLAYVGGLESIWTIDYPIPSFPTQSVGTVERAIRAINKLPLFQENMKIQYFLEGLNLAYSPEMPLNEYVRVFTPDRRKELRKLLAGVIKHKEKAEDTILEINRSIQELERLAETKGWRFLSHGGSLMKANALTLAGTVAGWVGGGPEAALVGAVLAKLAEIKMPEEVSKDLTMFDERIAVALSAMILRQSPGILHVVQTRKSLAELRHSFHSNITT